MTGPLAYIGGKRRLAPLISSLLPSHTTYVEPFAGGCQVFFCKAPSKVEVLNDLDEQVINFLRVCQHHADELARTLALVVASRKQHEQYLRQDPLLLTDIQRAARFLYLQKNSFGGHVARQTFHFCVSKPSNYNPIRLPSVLSAAAERLQRVQLECSSYEHVLLRYDRPTTLFYVDPPYIGLKLYRHNFGDDDFRHLAQRLASLKGKFLLSINDCEFARDIFGGFEIRTVPISYTSSRAVPLKDELLVSNFSQTHLNDPTHNVRELSSGGSP